MSSDGQATEGQEALERERLILRGLACEWEAARALLGSAERARLRRPLFRLQEARRSWGAWAPKKREISLSRELVLCHSWDSVREVLLHETAHQLADEVLGGAREPPHGPAFRRACSMLRVDPGVGESGPPLDVRLRTAPDAAQSGVLSRVRKLMALAGSPNAHEAEAAMAKARQLMEKHQLDLLERGEPRPFASLFLGRPALRQPREMYSLALLLQDFYLVQGVWVPAYVLEKGRMGRVLEVSGTRENVQMAAYVHDFVCRFVDARWHRYNRGRRLGRRRKTDYALGVLEGFRRKMEAVPAPPAADARPAGALVRPRDLRLDRYVAGRYPRLISRGVRGAAEDPGVRRDGERAGRDLVIHRGVRGRQARGRLLPGASPGPERWERCED